MAFIPAPGGGTVVQVTLPLADPALRAAG
jgi:hypothetical protein